MGARAALLAVAGLAYVNHTIAAVLGSKGSAVETIAVDASVSEAIARLVRS